MHKYSMNNSLRRKEVVFMCCKVAKHPVMAGRKSRSAKICFSPRYFLFLLNLKYELLRKTKNILIFFPVDNLNRNKSATTNTVKLGYNELGC
jgi:hypothetical protein